MSWNSATVDELMSLAATDQAAFVRKRAVSWEELVEASIERIERLNRSLNAVIHPMFEKARHQLKLISAAAPFGQHKRRGEETMAPLDERTIAELARAADLPLTAERLRLIAPQLEALVQAANELNRKMAEPRMRSITPNVRFVHAALDQESRS